MSDVRPPLKFKGICVSSYYSILLYICVLILLYVCPHTTVCVSACYIRETEGEFQRETAFEIQRHIYTYVCIIRTYVCMVSIAAGNGCAASNAWASGCRVVTITSLPRYGTLNPNTQRICTGGNPAALTFQDLPVGGTITYQWYYKNGQSLICPSGTSTTGWTIINGATSSTYDPPAGLTTSRTYACMVSSSGTGVCTNGTGWATNCVKQIVVPPPTYGTLASGNENVCIGGNPGVISFVL